MALVARQALLDLADGQQLVALDDAAELADERDVLADVAAELAEFGVLLDKLLHVGDRLDRRGRVRERPLREVLHVCVEVGAEVAKVGKEVRREEGVLRRREDDVLRAGGGRVSAGGRRREEGRASRPTLSSGFFSSSSRTRLLAMPMSSWTIAW